MRQSKNPELKFILALMPLFLTGDSFYQTFCGIIFSVFAVFGAVSFLNLTAPLFPKKLLRAALVLLVGAAYQAFGYFIEIPALWIVSFFLLFDWNDIDPNRLGAKSLPFLSRLAAFAGSGGTLLFVREVLAKNTGAALFYQPAGTLMLFAVMAYLFPRVIPIRGRENA